MNILTEETKSIIDFDNNPYAVEELWEEDIEEIEKNRDKYFAFERMESRESFQVMMEFVETVEDEKLKEKLELILNLAKPFWNFKDINDNEEEYRQKWFAFRESKYAEL